MMSFYLTKKARLLLYTLSWCHITTLQSQIIGIYMIMMSHLMTIKPDYWFINDHDVILPDYKARLLVYTLSWCHITGLQSQTIGIYIIMLSYYLTTEPDYRYIQDHDVIVVPDCRARPCSSTHMVAHTTSQGRSWRGYWGCPGQPAWSSSCTCHAWPWWPLSTHQVHPSSCPGACAWCQHSAQSLHSKEPYSSLTRSGTYREPWQQCGSRKSHRKRTRDPQEA